MANVDTSGAGSDPGDGIEPLRMQLESAVADLETRVESGTTNAMTFGLLMDAKHIAESLHDRHAALAGHASANRTEGVAKVIARLHAVECALRGTGRPQ